MLVTDMETKCVGQKLGMLVTNHGTFRVIYMVLKKGPILDSLWSRRISNNFNIDFSLRLSSNIFRTVKLHFVNVKR